MTLPEPARTLLLQGWPAIEKAAERVGISAREGAGLYEEERGRETAVQRPTPIP